jgi:hypothetical protein
MQSSCMHACHLQKIVEKKRVVQACCNHSSNWHHAQQMPSEALDQRCMPPRKHACTHTFGDIPAIAADALDAAGRRSRSEQLSPRHPSLHTQTDALHMPLREQSSSVEHAMARCWPLAGQGDTTSASSTTVCTIIFFGCKAHCHFGQNKLNK